MLRKPLGCQTRYLFEGSRFLEKMRGTRHDHELLVTAEPGQRLPVQSDYRKILTSHNEEGRGAHLCQGRPSQVWAASAGNARADSIGTLGRRDQRSRGTGTRPKISDVQV